MAGPATHPGEPGDRGEVPGPEPAEFQAEPEPVAERLAPAEPPDVPDDRALRPSGRAPLRGGSRRAGRSRGPRRPRGGGRPRGRRRSCCRPAGREAREGRRQERGVLAEDDRPVDRRGPGVVLDHARGRGDRRVLEGREPGVEPARGGEARVLGEGDHPAGRGLQAQASEPGDARAGRGEDPAGGTAVPGEWRSRADPPRHGGQGGPTTITSARPASRSPSTCSSRSTAGAESLAAMTTLRAGAAVDGHSRIGTGRGRVAVEGRAGGRSARCRSVSVGGRGPASGGGGRRPDSGRARPARRSARSSGRRRRR